MTVLFWLKKYAVALYLIILFGSYVLGSMVGYNRGLKDFELQVLKSNEQISQQLKLDMREEFEKQHKKLDKLKELQNEEFKEIKEQYKTLGNCHTLDGLRLFNEQIRKLNESTKSSI